MKTFYAVVLGLFYMVQGSPAFAKDIPLINLSCEAAPDIHIPIGVVMSDQNQRLIQGIFFVDDHGARKAFTVQQLHELTPVYALEGREVAFVSIATNPNAGTAGLYLEYLKNGILGTHSSIQFNLRYNSSMNIYQVINPADERPVSEAYIILNRIGGRVIGIKRIVMR